MPLESSSLVPRADDQPGLYASQVGRRPHETPISCSRGRILASHSFSSQTGVMEAARPVETAASAGAGVVGRDQELATVSAFLGEEPRSPRALVIEGEAGIGKTTIVQTAFEQASLAGLRLLVARPAAGELELPYAGLGDLLAGIGSDVLGMLARPQRRSEERRVG